MSEYSHPDPLELAKRIEQAVNDPLLTRRKLGRVALLAAAADRLADEMDPEDPGASLMRVAGRVPAALHADSAVEAIKQSGDNNNRRGERRHHITTLTGFNRILRQSLEPNAEHFNPDTLGQYLERIGKELGAPEEPRRNSMMVRILGAAAENAYSLATERNGDTYEGTNDREDALGIDGRVILQGQEGKTPIDVAFGDGSRNRKLAQRGLTGKTTEELADQARDTHRTITSIPVSAHLYKSDFERTVAAPESTMQRIIPLIAAENRGARRIYKAHQEGKAKNRSNSRRPRQGR